MLPRLGVHRGSRSHQCGQQCVQVAGVAAHPRGRYSAVDALLAADDGCRADVDRRRAGVVGAVVAGSLTR